MNNLYNILGIDKDSNLSDIKKAYHKLAIKYHPDKCIDGKDKFQEITDAYSVLSDDSKRKMYDMTGISESININPEEIFSQLFSEFKPDIIGNFSDSLLEGFGGINIKTVPLNENVSDIFKNTMPSIINSFSNIITGKSMADNLDDNIIKGIIKEVVTPEINKNTTVKKNINIKLKDLYSGKIKKLKINYNNNTEIIKTKLFLNKQLIFKIKKSNTIDNIIITMNCKDKNYLIDNYNLILYKNITIKDLYLGFKDKIIKPNNKIEEFNILPGELFKNQTKIIKNIGLLNENNKRGNIIIKYNIEFIHLKNNIKIEDVFI